MEEILRKNKRERMTKIKEADQKPLKPESNIKVNGGCYFWKLEGNLKLEDVDGPASLDNLTRRVFIVRLKDIHSFLDDGDERLKTIQKESGATIAIISSPEVKFHIQAYLELWGTVGQVKTAQLRIVEAITKTYHESFVPTVLMQAPLSHDEVYVPLAQAIRLMGEDFENLVKMEAQSGAWIEVDRLEAPPPRHLWMRRLKLFGSRAQIYRAMVIVFKAMLEPYIPDDQESANLEDEEHVEEDK